MGDKSPKSNDRKKKQDAAAKNQKQAGNQARAKQASDLPLKKKGK
ncbi:MAG: hypothetical protein SGI90_07845 [Candidatus Eisenbacteria bacterium]|nr:hypothetical protein [Candidatus Eisenbacteria bacterium]